MTKRGPRFEDPFSRNLRLCSIRALKCIHGCNRHNNSPESPLRNICCTEANTHLGSITYGVVVFSGLN
jgi:hypothetical protein